MIIYLKVPEWRTSLHYKRVEIEPISFDDCLLAHTEDFVAALKAGDEAKIKECYELLDSEGRYHHYDPKNATKPLEDLIAMQLTLLAP